MPSKATWEIAVAAVLTTAIGVITNYATDDPPSWLAPPLSWLILIGLLATLVAFSMLVKRRDSRVKPSLEQRESRLRRAEKRLLETNSNRLIPLLLDGSIDRRMAERFERSRSRTPIRFRAVPARSVGLTPFLSYDAAVAFIPASATSLVDLYDVNGNALLVTGDTGAGKSTQLQDLFYDLTAKAFDFQRQKRNDLDLVRLPVWIDLAKFSSGSRFDEWLTEQIVFSYQVKPSIVRSWIDDDKLVILLDNLGWQSSDTRGQCISALSLFMREHIETVVILTGPEDLSGRLYDDLDIAIVHIEPLSAAEIVRYLEGIEGDYSALMHRVGKDPALTEACGNRLVLSAATIALSGRNDPALMGARTATEFRDIVLDRYLEFVMTREDRVVPRTLRLDLTTSAGREQLRVALSYVARVLHKTESVYLIDLLSVVWIGDPRRRRRTKNKIVVGCGAVTFALAYLLSSLALSGTVSLVSAIVVTFINSLLTRLVGNVDQTVRESATLRFRIGWSWSSFLADVRSSLKSYIVFSLTVVAAVYVASRIGQIGPTAMARGLIGSRTISYIAVLGALLVVLILGVFILSGSDLVESDARRETRETFSTWRTIRQAWLVLAGPLLVFLLPLVSCIVIGLAAVLDVAGRAKNIPSSTLLGGFIEMILDSISDIYDPVWGDFLHGWTAVIICITIGCALGMLLVFPSSVAVAIGARMTQNALIQAGVLPGPFPDTLRFAAALGVLQRFGGEYCFIHQTFAMYLVSRSVRSA